MLKPAVILLAALLTASAGTLAQESSPLMTLLAEPPAPPPEPLTIEIRTLTIAEAASAAERLSDDILVLSRIVALQESLLEINATRIASGAPPLAIPRRICAASPLAAMCDRLAFTFEPAGSPP